MVLNVDLNVYASGHICSKKKPPGNRFRNRALKNFVACFALVKDLAAASILIGFIIIVKITLIVYKKQVMRKIF
ncbi:hypothetical protein MgSA37_03488 [Mucilaginibacter gotjawali]|uniref:Uncharacterized protein n=2 Tax=Mucilaginibacter gotjawali TaxID=1550579 RepID=A0A0X8X563_9SPHI|nr:hypothetical protein [Mucilaginibacter gotjawali]BAU55307.1 hypothetical protein MgSA37_03488 [Mucilaginibacter gotjawali]